MNRNLKYALGGLLVVGVVAVLFVSGTALAQDATPPAPDAQAGQNGGPGPGSCGGEKSMEAAASVLGLTVEEMRTQMWGGRNLADLADRAGVELQAVKDAMQSACNEQVKASVEQAVTDGDMSREKADWLLEGLDKGFWGSGSDGGFGGFFGAGDGGFGRSRGFDRMGGPGMGRRGGQDGSRMGGPCGQGGRGMGGPGGQGGPGQGDQRGSGEQQNAPGAPGEPPAQGQQQ